MVRQVILAPAATPAPLMDRIQREVAAVLAEPATRTRLAELGAERLVGNTPAEAQRFVAQEMARWAVILREAGVRAG
jgi:tripartite-type tricarboxylate transporter receptor subunit TctC